MMRIYLAGGMSVSNLKGRERELANQMPRWNRVFSYHFKHTIFKSEILNIAHENIFGRRRSRQ